MATRLFMKTLKRIDLVDRGADPRASVVIWKRDASADLCGADVGWKPCAMPKGHEGDHNPTSLTQATKRSLVQKLIAFFKDEGMTNGAEFETDEPTTFADEMAERRMGDVREAFADNIGALYATVNDVLADGSGADKSVAITAAIDDFAASVKAEVAGWLSGAVAKVGRKISAARLAKLREMVGVLQGVIAEQESADGVAKGNMEAPAQRVRDAFSSQFNYAGSAGYQAWVQEIDDDAVIAELSNPAPGASKYRKIPWSDVGGRVVFDTLAAEDVERTWTPVGKGDSITKKETEMAKIAVATLAEGVQFILKGAGAPAEVDEAQVAFATELAATVRKAKEPPVDDGLVAVSKADVAALSEPVRAFLVALKIDAPTRADVAYAKRACGEVTEDVFKGMSPQARAQFVKVERDNAELRTRVEKAETDRQRERYMTEAAALGLKADDDWVILKALDGIVEKVGEQTVGARTRQVIKALNEQIKTGKLFTEIGTTVGDPAGGAGTAWSEIVTKAEEAVTKSTSGLTREQAIAQAIAANPKLYERHEAETAAARNGR